MFNRSFNKQKFIYKYETNKFEINLRVYDSKMVIDLTCSLKKKVQHES